MPTSTTLDGAVAPAAVGPDVEVLGVPLVVPAAPVPGGVHGHGVLVVDAVGLVVEQQHLERRGEEGRTEVQQLVSLSIRMDS